MTDQFALTDDQLAIQDMARRFTADRIAPFAADWDEKHVFPKDTISEAAPTRIRAAFDFTGEGMTWQREVVLDVQDDGATLIRREYGQDAAPGPFRYARCQQGR